MKEPRKNASASVSARLLDLAHKRGDDFNLSLQRYSAERFLYRLGESRPRRQFILKGAMLFALWGGSFYRATRDLDLTGYTDDDAEGLVRIVQEICAVQCPCDGLAFHTETVQAEPIRHKGEYHGFQVKLRVMLGTARLSLQIDVGFGDAIKPPAIDAEYPTLLDAPPPRIRVYPREAVIAEKLHAMVFHDLVNSRYKDFYDLFVLATHFSFSGQVLAGAITATFARRRTVLAGKQPAALSPAF
ncbi:MAG: nucleotidyl transferase AbiEii/AbiGii toxin family protein, partial [Geobacter sp.]|nr:nucleotidyl transferase AbiEii/AbiGii toxin family protein [Geobacter sp.]